MSLATICLAIACVLPILCAGLAKRGGIANRSFDNRAPRQSRTAVLTIGLTPGEPCAAVRVTPMALGPGYRPRPAGRADARLVRQALGAVAPCAR